jgi:peptide deformylase
MSKGKNKQKSKRKNHTKRNPIDKSTYTIIKEDDPRLYEVGSTVYLKDEVGLDNLKKISKKMKLTALKLDGAGLAMCQCDTPFQTLAMFVMNIIGTNKFVTVINPKIKHKSLKKVEMEEGCLSVEGKYMVKRPESATVSYYCLEEGKVITEKLEGFQLRVWLHEEFHCRGKTMKDIGKLVEEI